MNTLLLDLRYAGRMMLKSPGTTLIAIVSLALGIGANTAMFSVLNAVLLRPFPFPQPDRLITVSGVNPKRPQEPAVLSTYDIEDWAKASKTIASFGVWRNGHFSITEKGRTEAVASGIASAGLFDVLAVKPAVGRFFTAAEDQPGRNHVIVLSYGLWQQRFGGDAKVVGATIHLNEQPYTIVGVLPRDFELPSLDWVALWAPNSNDEDLQKGRWLRNRQVLARMRPGVTLQQAEAEIETLAAQTAQQYPDTHAGWSARIEPLAEHEVGDTRRPLGILFGAVAVVLLIATVNVVNLILTRVTVRRGEFAVRLALGARVSRVGRLLITETLLLCVFGGALGVFITAWSLKGLVALAPPGTPRLDQVHLDVPAFVFAAVLSLLIGVIVGLAPAWRAGKLNVEQALKETGSQRSGRRSSAASAVLARVEVALSMMLLVGAALLSQTFLRLLTLPPDFRPDGVLTIEVFPPYPKYIEQDRVLDFYRRVTSELSSIPGVQSVAQASAGPYFGGYEAEELAAAEQPESNTDKYPEARYYNVSPGYFSTLGISLLNGRDFTAQDTAGATPVAIVSQTLARRLWPNQDPLGKRVRSVRDKSLSEVVGVAADVRTWPKAMTAEPEIYYPYAQRTRWVSVFVVRTGGPPAALAATVRERVWAVDSNTLMGPARTMREAMMRPLRSPRFNMLLMVLFASMATILAVVGVYGVISFTTAQRTREIGVRMALGASRAAVLRMVLARSMSIVLVGVSAGAAAFLVASRLLTSLLYGVRATDVTTISVVALLLTAVTLIACIVPARRAADTDPLQALRAE